jgi:hypothetical protein
MVGLYNLSKIFCRPTRAIDRANEPGEKGDQRIS